MVQQHPATQLDQLSVDGATLMLNGHVIAETPTAIAEVARLDDRIFLVLDGDPKIDDEAYLGENLWCINHTGTLLWKAENLMQYNWSGRLTRNAYRALRILGTDSYRLNPQTMEDRQVIYLDPASGRVLPPDSAPWRPDAPENKVLATSKLYRYVMAS